ncbi:MAG TPA: NfeD family protein [Clostridiaceae bacterium]|nr:NfeD family protein [Clostridiaceae bacterium]
MYVTAMAAEILGLSAIVFWVLIFAMAVIVELVTYNLVSIWFAVAALAAMIASIFEASLVLQFVLFGLLSIAGFLLFIMVIRPRLGQRVITPTNADRILDKEGVVTEEIHSVLGTGLVKVEGQVWSARIEGDGLVKVGTLVRVVAIRGVRAIVSPVEGAISPLE